MLKNAKYLIAYIAYLLAVWTLYRFSGIVVSQELDEFVIKPFVWLLPIFVILKLESQKINSLGITSKNFLPGVYLALVLGLIFALEAAFVSYLKYGQIRGNNLMLYPIGISLATATVEEIVFRGYIFSRISGLFKKEIFAILVTSALWVLIHIPATFAVFGYNINDAIGFWFLAFVYSLGACFIFAKTKNVFACITLFILWEASLILLR